MAANPILRPSSSSVPSFFDRIKEDSFSRFTPDVLHRRVPVKDPVVSWAFLFRAFRSGPLAWAEVSCPAVFIDEFARASFRLSPQRRSALRVHPYSFRRKPECLRRPSALDRNKQIFHGLGHPWRFLAYTSCSSSRSLPFLNLREALQPLDQVGDSRDASAERCCLAKRVRSANVYFHEN